MHPPGPPGDPPGRKNGPFSGGKTSESTVEGPKFRGVFSGGHPGAPGGEFREISGNSGKFRPNYPQNQPHLPLFFPILNLRKHGRTAEMPGEISGEFRGGNSPRFWGEATRGKHPVFRGKIRQNTVLKPSISPRKIRGFSPGAVGGGRPGGNFREFWPNFPPGAKNTPF